MKRRANVLLALVLLALVVVASPVFSAGPLPTRPQGTSKILSGPIKPLPYCTDLQLGHATVDGCVDSCNVYGDALLVTGITISLLQKDPNPEVRCEYRPVTDYEATLRYTSFLTGREETLKYIYGIGTSGTQQLLDRKLFYVKSIGITIDIKPVLSGIVGIVDRLIDNNKLVVGQEGCGHCYQGGWANICPN